MSVDLAIVGAGPAGMAAAVEAAGLGLSVMVLDEQPAPGGQVFRAVERAAADPALAGDFIDAGCTMAADFRATPGIVYCPRSTLWHLDPDAGVLSILSDGVASEIAARRVLLATGAQERPVPIPGWTLPGVMSAGAAQIMLKTAGAIPTGPVVIAGQGPLCWLLAAQLLRAGVERLVLLETGSRSAVWDAIQAGGLWRGRKLLRKGLALVRETRSRGLRVVRGVRGLRAEGDGRRIQTVRWDGGAMACDTLLLHEGVIPATHITRALGLDHDWDDRQLCWRPRLDAWGATSHRAIAVAGDGGGIGGWEAAANGGRLAAIDAAYRLGRLDAAARDARAAAPRTDLRAALSLRPFLDRLYAPSQTVLMPDDATIVCRCEEVTAGQIREAVRLGATGPNQVKAFLRAGMGPCQGRMCGTTVAALIARTRGVSMHDVDALRPRAPFKPMTVGELAAFKTEDV